MKEIIGPELPPHLQKQRQSEQTETKDNEIVGPQLPSEFQRKQEQTQDTDNDIYGPMPVSDNIRKKYEERDRLKRLREIDERASGVKQSAPSTKPIAKREEWMTVPPEANRLDKIDFSKSRGFRKTTSELDNDQSGWTAVPGENRETKKPKIQDQSAADVHKDRLYRDRVAEYNTANRSLSLMEEHQKNGSINKSTESPKRFDRERDIVARSLTHTDKTKMVNDARSLNSKFQHGSSSFL